LFDLAALFVFELFGLAAGGWGGCTAVGGGLGQVIVFHAQNGAALDAVQAEGVVATAKNGAFAAKLFPTSFVIERTAFGANDWAQVNIVHIVFYWIGTNGAMQTKLIRFVDVIKGDANWR
jgi:hypothetical protein